MIVVVIGLALTVLAGVNLVTGEKVIDVGKTEMMVNKNHLLDWTPYLGIAIGLIIYVVGARKK